MSLFELLGFLLLIALVVLGSRELGHLFGLPEAALVIPIVALFILVVHIWKKNAARALLIPSIFLVVASLLSIATAHVFGLREPIFAAPIAVGIVFIAIQSKLLSRWRAKRSDTSKRG